MARNIHLYFLIGDIASVIFVVYIYSLIDSVTLNQAVWQKFQDVIIDLYMWMEPLQSVQLHGNYRIYIVVELFAYGLLMVFLVVVIAISRNVIGAFSQFHIKNTPLNSCLGCMRNIAIVIVMWSLLPRFILDTYWFQEIYQSTMLRFLL